MKRNIFVYECLWKFLEHLRAEYFSQILCLNKIIIVKYICSSY
jgi:hypothetical protein